MSDTTSIKLSDQSISLIAKALQVAILTGTDVVDNLRMIRFETDNENKLVPTGEYAAEFNKSIDALMEEAISADGSTQEDLNEFNNPMTEDSEDSEVDVADW